MYRIKLTTGPGTLGTITVKSTGSPGKTSALTAYKNPTTGKTELYVGTDIGTIYKTTDAWATTPVFTQLGTINAGNVSSISVLNKDTLAVTLSNYGIKNVYVSTDAGSTWGVKDVGFPDMPIWSLLFNPKRWGEVLIATELGVYGTNNIYSAVPTWTEYNLGMGPVKTLQLKYRSSDQTVMAVTHGRGIFTSNAWSILDPIANFGFSDINPCANQIVTMNDSTQNFPTSWKWSFFPPAYVSYTTGDSTSKNPKVKFLAKGTYSITLSATNVSGTTSKTKFINVQDTIGLGLFVSHSPLKPCYGDSVGFISQPTNSKMTGLKLKYQWYMNGVILAAKDTFSYLKKYNIALDSSNYSVKVTSTAKCAVPLSVFSNNDAVVLKVKKISIICSNDTFYVVNKPTGGSVKWFRNGQNVGTGDFYHAKQKGNYNAIYMNSGCSSDSSNKISLMSVGVSNNKSMKFGKLYPNPAKDWLYWDSKSEGTLEIWSSNGQICIEQSIEVNKSYKLNVSSLAKGIYTIRLRNSNNRQYIDQIVIQ